MIVRMSKVEIIGTRQLLGDVLTLVRERGDLHIEPSTAGFVDTMRDGIVQSLLTDQKTLFEKIFLEKLQDKLTELFSYLPRLPVRQSYLSPASLIDTINRTLDKHLEQCKELAGQQRELHDQIEKKRGYLAFFNTMGGLIENLGETSNLELIGLSLKDADAVQNLRKLLNQLTAGSFELLTDTTPDGSLLGLIAIEKSLSDDLRSNLSEKQLPEFIFPESFRELTIAQKMDYLAAETLKDQLALTEVEKKLRDFVRRWGPIYKGVRDWLTDRFSILKATSLVFESRLCFFVYGWMPSEKVPPLREALDEHFEGNVHLDEMEITKEDLERIPVILQNPAYFKPFEKLARLLPLPAYSSYDPTPFIGIFFPAFFGVILGDAGYGVLLVGMALLAIKRTEEASLFHDLGKIMGVCGLYSIVFGFLYGELFGNLGQHLFHLKPLLIDRHTNILPMLYFSVTVGLVHVVLGLVLGIITDLRRKTRKEALAKTTNILLIGCLTLLIISFYDFYPALLTRPIIIAILLLTPVLLFSGGLLAPLELLKNFGNIVSYARIMAIGLTSVLLALVANRLAGLTGDIVLGAVVGGLLHLINITIGVFSSSIHSLRLHYVEFFDKFIESGGREFTPFDKKEKSSDLEE